MIEVNTQSSIKIGNIYFDPFKIDKEYGDARFIFITHSHYDHFDMDSINKVRNDSTIFVVPNDEDIISKLKGCNLFVCSINKEYEVGGIKFRTIPAYNLNKSFHKKDYGWLGYVVYLDKSYYIMGDTDVTEEALMVKCDYLFVPIGGTYTMDYKEAIDYVNSIKPKYVTPIHYGSIVGNFEMFDEFADGIDDDVTVINLLNIS